MDKEIEELENMLEAQKSKTTLPISVGEPSIEEVKSKDKKKVEFGDFEFVFCIKKTWLAIVLSVLMYCGIALVPILIALITR